jgi:methylthioribulose-1-phosphate dehydratase
MKTILNEAGKRNFLAVPSVSSQQIRGLICELCRHLYKKGWASGTGGGISIKNGDRIYMAPSAVQKERLRPEDIFVLDSGGVLLEEPGRGLALSQCAPLFMHAYQIRNAGAVIHSHSVNAVLATLLFGKAFRIKNMEMQKGIEGYGAFDTVEVPIIENTAFERDLADSLGEAIRKNPKTQAVLVRGHGVYVWGRDWEQAKVHAECYDYLFGLAGKMKHLGLLPDH